jgi:hypothetical protein
MLAARRSRGRRTNWDLGAVGSPKMSVAPLQLLLLVFAGWVNRRQLEIVEFLQEETAFCASSSAPACPQQCGYRPARSPSLARSRRRVVALHAQRQGSLQIGWQ